MLKKVIAFIIVLFLVLFLYIAYLAKLDMKLPSFSKKEYVVSVILQARGTSFWKDVEKGAKSLNAKNLKIIVNGPEKETDFFGQSELVNEAINNKVSAIVIAPQNAAVVSDALKRAAEAGIKLVMIDSSIDIGKKTPLVMSDNSKIGVIAAEGILKSGKIKKVLIIRGVWGDDSQDQRAAAAADVFNKAGVEIVACESANSDRVAAESLTLQWLENVKDIDAIFATNDDMAIGAGKAEVKSHYPTPIFIAGVDATPDGVEAIKSGVIDATVSQDAFEIGRIGVIAAVDMLNGKSVVDLTDVPVQLLTKYNVE